MRWPGFADIALDASLHPNNVPFWRTYKEEDKFSLVVTTGAVFPDVPDMKTAMAPRLTRAEVTGKLGTCCC